MLNLWPVVEWPTVSWYSNRPASWVSIRNLDGVHVLNSYTITKPPTTLQLIGLVVCSKLSTFEIIVIAFRFSFVLCKVHIASHTFSYMLWRFSQQRSILPLILLPIVFCKMQHALLAVRVIDVGTLTLKSRFLLYVSIQYYTILYTHTHETFIGTGITGWHASHIHKISN